MAEETLVLLLFFVCSAAVRQVPEVSSGPGTGDDRNGTLDL